MLQESGPVPDRGEEFLDLGKEAMKRGEHEKALEMFDKGLETQGSSGELLMEKGKCLEHLKRFEEAMRCYDKALVIDLGNPKLWTRKGQVLTNLHRYDEAKRSFDRAITMDPLDPEPYLQKGIMHMTNRDYQEALMSLDRALELDPGDHKAWFYKANTVSLAEGDFSAAVTLYEKALEIEPGNIIYLLNKGVAQRSLGELKEASRSFDEVLRLDPGNMEASKGRDYCNARLKKAQGETYDPLEESDVEDDGGKDLILDEGDDEYDRDEVKGDDAPFHGDKEEEYEIEWTEDETAMPVMEEDMKSIDISWERGDEVVEQEQDQEVQREVLDEALDEKTSTEIETQPVDTIPQDHLKIDTRLEDIERTLESLRLSLSGEGMEDKDMRPAPMPKEPLPEEPSEPVASPNALKWQDESEVDTITKPKDEELDDLEEFEVVKMVKCPRCDKLLPIPSDERPLAIECFRCGARGKLTK